jgi:hypothetical protein
MTSLDGPHIVGLQFGAFNSCRRVDDALREYDFSQVRARGISEMDLREILDRMFTGDEMAREMRLKKAQELGVELEEVSG